VNLVNLTLFAAHVSGVYLLWIWVPLWLDDLDVREALAAAVGQLGDPAHDDRVRLLAAGRLATVGTHWEERDGKQVEVQGLEVHPEDIQIEREGRLGRASLDYDRTVKLKPLEQYWTIHFHTMREGRLQ